MVLTERHRRLRMSRRMVRQRGSNVGCTLLSAGAGF